jgi:hypothetical protein
MSRSYSAVQYSDPRYSIGPLNIAVTGGSQYREIFSKELQLVDRICDPDIVIHFSNSGDEYTPSHYCGKNTIDFNKSGYAVNGNPYFGYHTHNPFSKGPIVTTIKVKQPGVVHSILRALKMASSVEYGSLSCFLRGELASYSYLWTLITLGLLKKKAAFIHSGVLCRNGQALVLSGTGGCGKTSTVLNLLQESGVDYLAEDFGIVSADGFAYPSTKTVSLYHSDVIRSGGTGMSAVSKLSWSQRIRWEVLTKLLKRNPIIKVSPAHLIEKPVAPSPVPIGFGVYLSRQAVDKVSVHEISHSEFSRRSAMASIRELKGLSEVLKLIQANSPLDYEFFSDEILAGKIEDIYLQAFSDKPVYLMAIPYQAGPKAVVDALYQSLSF